MKPETSCAGAVPAREHRNDAPHFEWDPTFAWFLLLFFLFNVGLGVFPPLLPQIMDDLGLSFASAGLLGTAFGLFRFLVDLPAGYLLERLGPRVVLHAAAGLLLLGTGVSALADSFWAEVCLLLPVGWAADVWGKARVVLPGFLAMLAGTLAVPLSGGAWGYGTAFTMLVGGMSVWMAAPALLAEQLAGGFRGKGAGLYRLVTDLGFIVAPGAVGWLIGACGFAMGSAVIAVVLVAAIALSLCYLRSPHPA